MRRWTWIVVLGVAGCAAKAQVPMQLSSAAGGADLSAIPQYVEIQHVEEGWLRVPVDVGEPKLQELSQGQTVELVVAEVPKGDYSAIRVGLVSPAPASEKRMVRAETGMDRGMSDAGGFVSTNEELPVDFCVKGKEGNELTLSLTQSSPGASPRLEVVEAPSC